MNRREILTGAISASAAFATQQAQARAGELQQAQYAIVELMGYKKLAGRLAQSPVPGMLQLDIPVEKGFITQMINPQSVYRITLCDEQTVKDVAKSCDPLPTLELEVPPRQLGMGFHDDHYEDDAEDWLR